MHFVGSTIHVYKKMGTCLGSNDELPPLQLLLCTLQECLYLARRPITKLAFNEPTARIRKIESWTRPSLLFKKVRIIQKQKKLLLLDNENSKQTL